MAVLLRNCCKGWVGPPHQIGKPRARTLDEPAFAFADLMSFGSAEPAQIVPISKQIDSCSLAIQSARRVGEPVNAREVQATRREGCAPRQQEAGKSPAAEPQPRKFPRKLGHGLPTQC